jgi:hypothetical protein
MSDLEPTHSQFLIYRDEVGNTRIDVRFDGETVWLTQAQIVELFDSSKANISEHVKNVFDEGELDPARTVREFRTVRREGRRDVQRSLTHYNLDMIISVGYRVKSRTATAFRIWATQRLHEYIVKGFVLDDERLKNPDLPFDYFDELLQRIQDIRTSERRFYQKITDVYATSIDYDATAPLTQTFYATVQNKLHWAITGLTAAEVIRQRADSSKPVEQYLVFAEGQAQRRVPMKMADWVAKLDGFLILNDRDILASAGKVSHELAAEHASAEFEKFKLHESRAIESDFDRFSKKMLSRGEAAEERQQLPGDQQ